jgi:hypothetical protein
MTHEDAMRQAAAERRRSQSARKPSHLPTKPNANAEAGPEASTTSQWRANLGLPDRIDKSLEPSAVPSPILFESSSPNPISLLSDHHPGGFLLDSDSPKPISAPVSSSGRVKPSPFQISDTPGSWGSAVPMSVAQLSRPRSNTPKSITAADPIASSSKKASVLSDITAPPTQVDAAKEAIQPTQHTQPTQSARPIQPAQPTQSIKPIRKGPTWKTAESPSPPPQELPIVPLPSMAMDQDQDELELEESSFNNGGSLDKQIFPGSSLPPISDTDVMGNDIEVDTGLVPDGSLAFDRTSPLPDLPSQELPVDPEEEALQSASVARSSQPLQGTADRIVVVGEQDSTIHDKDSDSAVPVDVAASSFELVQIDPEDTASFSAEIDHLLPSSEPYPDIVIAEEISSDLRDVDAALLDLLPVVSDNAMKEAIELNDIINDISESLPADMDHIDLSRSRESSSGGSFEEIPAEIARTQVVFSRLNAAQSSNRSGPSQAIKDDTLDVFEKRVLRSMLDDIAKGEPEASRPTRLKLKDKERTDSTSSSNSDSPSKRLSARLAGRTLTPVYSFNNSRSPIKWRQTVEMDGESEVEDLLRAASRSESSGPSSKTIDGVDRIISATYTIPIVDLPPPPERRSRAIREFSTKTIDDWNKRSSGLTSNPALHRLIFESYIQECVDGDEPEIGVYNTVDYESIPPNFEFQYSNNMLYGDDVPDPELGLGCDCEGGCSPTSESCSCLKRQRLYNYDVNDDFAYNEHGRLKENVPIWECGPNCGCPPECMNRVIQRGRTHEALIDLFKTVSLCNTGWLKIR